VKPGGGEQLAQEAHRPGPIRTGRERFAHDRDGGVTVAGQVRGARLQEEDVVGVRREPARLVEGGRELVGAHVAGVGVVEDREHTLDGALHQRVRKRAAHEVVGDALVRLGEGGDGRSLLVVTPGRAVAKRQAGPEDRGRTHGQQPQGHQPDAASVLSGRRGRVRLCREWWSSG